MAIKQMLVDTFDLQAIYFDIRNRMASLYQKPATGIPASDLAEGVIPDISGKADKTDTVLLTSLSRGRIPGRDIGDGSIAFGDGVIASGSQSQAFGIGTLASGYASHAEGYSTEASGYASHAEGFGGLVSGACAHKEGSSNTVTSPNGHAEGSSNVVRGNNAHAEGNGNTVTGVDAHVEGSGNTAKANSSHIGGMFSVADSYLTWEEWTADTLYEVGRKIKIGVSENNEIVYYGYICKTQNQDHEFDSSKWDLDYKMNFARIIGNGTNYNHRSNALALGWDGNLYLMGDVYVGCDSDSTGGQKVVTKSEIDGLGLTVENGKLCITVEDDTDEEEE